MLSNWIKRNLGMVSFLAFILLIFSSLIYSFGNGERKLSDIVIHIIEKIPLIEKKSDSLVQYSKNNLTPSEQVYKTTKEQIQDLEQIFEREIVWIDLQPKDNNTNQILNNYQSLISGLRANLNKQNQGILLQSQQFGNWIEISKLQNLNNLIYSELVDITKAIERLLDKLDYSTVNMKDVNDKAKILSQVETQKNIVLELQKIIQDKNPSDKLSESDQVLIKSIYNNELPSIPQIVEIKREFLFTETVESNRQAIIDQIKDYLK